MAFSVASVVTAIKAIGSMSCLNAQASARKEILADLNLVKELRESRCSAAEKQVRALVDVRAQHLFVIGYSSIKRMVDWQNIVIALAVLLVAGAGIRLCYPPDSWMKWVGLAVCGPLSLVALMGGLGSSVKNRPEYEQRSDT